jgi:thiol-disulfide isomerase/thioredoxin
MRRPLLVLALALSVGCASERSALARSWILGKPLDLGAESLSGEAVAVGGPDRALRVVILWASWCRSCYELFPALDVLAADAGARGMSIQAISVDEDLEKVREALPRVPQRVRVLWDRGAERLGERLGIEELPMILILDRAGVVRFVHDGTDERLLAQVDAELRALLRE